ITSPQPSNPPQKHRFLAYVIIILALTSTLFIIGAITFGILSQVKEYSYVTDIEGMKKDFTAAETVQIGPYKALVGDLTRNAAPPSSQATVLNSQIDEVELLNNAPSGSGSEAIPNPTSNQAGRIPESVEYVRLTMIYNYEDGIMSKEVGLLNAWPEALFAGIRLNGSSPIQIDSEFTGGYFSTFKDLASGASGQTVTYLFPNSAESEETKVTYSVNITTGKATVGDKKTSNTYLYTISF
ncbi:hypothetical protein B7Z28_01335, partial [Candidatus Saccharibacteria bacterium 32-45-3]